MNRIKQVPCHHGMEHLRVTDEEVTSRYGG